MRIAIIVEGGVVQDICADATGNLEVYLLDYDNIESGEVPVEISPFPLTEGAKGVDLALAQYQKEIDDYAELPEDERDDSND